jgi:hypothetical protein
LAWKGWIRVVPVVSAAVLVLGVAQHGGATVAKTCHGKHTRIPAPCKKIQPERFAVTVTASQTSTLTCSPANQPQTTLQLTASLSASAITATLSGGTLTFAPNPSKSALPMQATVTVHSDGCAGPSRTCGPATVDIVPGLLQLDAVGAELELGYDSNGKIFSDSDSCNSGLMETATMTTPFSAQALAGRQTTAVSGSWTRHEVFPSETEDTTVSYIVRFTRA